MLSWTQTNLLGLEWTTCGLIASAQGFHKGIKDFPNSSSFQTLESPVRFTMTEKEGAAEHFCGTGKKAVGNQLVAIKSSTAEGDQ